MQLYTICVTCLNEDGLEHWIKTWLELPRADHNKNGIEAEYFNCLSPTTDGALLMAADLAKHNNSS